MPFHWIWIKSFFDKRVVSWTFYRSSSTQKLFVGGGGLKNKDESTGFFSVQFIEEKKYERFLRQIKIFFKKICSLEFIKFSFTDWIRSLKLQNSMQNLWWNFWKTVKIETRFDLSCARFINPWSHYCKSLQLFSIRIFHIISETPKKTLMFEFILKFASVALLKEKNQFILFIKTLSMIKYFTCIDINSIHAGN